MIDDTAIPAFTDRLQYRVVGDTGLLVLIDGQPAFNARGIPQSFMLKVDGETSMGHILKSIDAELAEPSEAIRDSVDELVGRLKDAEAISFTNTQ